MTYFIGISPFKKESSLSLTEVAALFLSRICPKFFKVPVFIGIVAFRVPVRLPYPADYENPRKYAEISVITRLPGIFIFGFRKPFFRKIRPISAKI